MRILALFLALFIGSCTKSGSNESVLVLGTNSGYPPYESVNSAGKIEGFDIDVAQAIAKRLNKKLVIKDMGFDALILSLKQGKVDMIMAGMSITPERQKEIAMIPYQGEPVKSLSLVFWEQIPDSVKSVNDLAKTKKPVVVQIGTYMEQYLKTVEGVQVKTLDATPELVMDIKHKKSVAALLEPHIADDVMPKNPELKRLDIQLAEKDWVLGNGIGIKKGNDKAIQDITKAIEELKKDKTLPQLEAKWFTSKPS